MYPMPEKGRVLGASRGSGLILSFHAPPTSQSDCHKHILVFKF